MIKEIKPTVFVVDDDTAVRDSLRMLLKSVGLPVEVRSAGQRPDPSRDDALRRRRAVGAASGAGPSLPRAASTADRAGSRLP